VEVVLAVEVVRDLDLDLDPEVDPALEVVREADQEAVLFPARAREVVDRDPVQVLAQPVLVRRVLVLLDQEAAADLEVVPEAVLAAVRDREVVQVQDQDQDQDQDGAGLTAQNVLMHQVFRSLRERRHQGLCDRVRIQKMLVSRKGLRKKRRPPADIKGGQEYIAPSCTRTAINIPTVAPEADPMTSSFSTSTRGLLQQLREIDSGDTPIITSPVGSSSSSPSIRGAARVLIEELLAEGRSWQKPDLLIVGEDSPLHWNSEELYQINKP